MYWIYFSTFILILFVPIIVRHGFYGFNLVQTQEFAIFFLGLLGFILFMIQDKILKKNLIRKKTIQKQLNATTKDLNQSYSYIGEINRKLDILEQITLSYPESHVLTLKKQKAAYNSIMEAIRLLGKSDEFLLRFTRTSTKEILKEIKSFPDLVLNFSCKNINSAAEFFESDDFIIITSPKAMDDVISCVIIKKKNLSHKIDDLEIFKAIASQALFFFMFIHQKNKKIA